MCGRFQFVPKSSSVFLEWGLEDSEELQVMEELLAERYNIAPTQEVAVVRLRSNSDPEDGRMLEGMRWGLVPPWATEGRSAAGFINARVETAAEKPTFRDPWKDHRCLIPATGYYEWAKKGGPPTLVQRESGRPMTFAGLWTPSREGHASSCTILTMAAGEGLSQLHHRMPVLLRREEQGEWLAAGGLPFEIGNAPVVPFPVSTVVVSKRLNKVQEQGASLMEPDPEPPSPPEQLDLFG